MGRSSFCCLLCVFFVLVVVQLELGAAQELKPFPSFVNTCRNNAELNSCMTKNLIAYKQLLYPGSEEFQVIQLEPMHLKNFIVSEKTRTNGLRISASDVRIYNATKYTPSKMNCDYGVKCTLDMYFPNLYVTGTYHVDGQIVALPIKGAGPMIASFDNVVGTDNSIYFGERIKDGVSYGKVTKVDVHVSFKGGNLKLDNLFNGDKILGQAVNDAINANLVELSKDLQPIVNAALNREFTKAADRILRQYTTEQLFPKD